MLIRHLIDAKAIKKRKSFRFSVVISIIIYLIAERLGPVKTVIIWIKMLNQCLLQLSKVL